MSRTVSRCLLRQSPLTFVSKDAPILKSTTQSLRQFSSSNAYRADNPPKPTEPFVRFRAAQRAANPNAAVPRSPSLNPKSAAGGSGGTQGLAGLFSDMVGHNRMARSKPTTILDTNRSSDGSFDGGLMSDRNPHKITSWQLHVNAHRHNVHITIVRPPNWQHPETGVRYGVNGERTVAMSMSAGNLGFRHAGRKHYDSAFQLASYVFTRMQESGMSGWIRELEVSLRGFGAGREAVSKALMGTEGRALRGKVTKVSDATRLKFGGTRSPKPRRLG